MIMTDIVVTLNNEKIVLIERTKEPFINKLVLPGGHVEPTDIRVVDACIREAKEEIGLVVKKESLKLLAILDKPGCDPRYEKRVSIVYHINVMDEQIIKNLKPASDAKAIHVMDIKNIEKEKMGFDHWDAIKLLK